MFLTAKIKENVELFTSVRLHGRLYGEIYLHSTFTAYMPFPILVAFSNGIEHKNADRL